MLPGWFHSGSLLYPTPEKALFFPEFVCPIIADDYFFRQGRKGEKDLRGIF